MVYVAAGNAADQGRHVTLRKGRLVIGTSTTCGFRLSDPKLSRTHVELAVTPKGIRARDLGSTNGTRLLGHQINEALCAPGARLTLGKTVVTLLPLPGGEGLELSSANSYGDLVGGSLTMRKLYTVLRRIEDSEAPVLIQGETGTGKELVARAIHEHSKRRDKPFIVVDCGNLSSTLAQSELFGHVKGAFTDARADRPGAFERADGGTIFLDEIGELPIAMQPLLLRALDTAEVTRLGDGQVRRVDVRVIAATHRDLDAAIGKGAFREDLFYRLGVVNITTPPLRKRGEDIPTLVRRFVALHGKGDDEELPSSLVRGLQEQNWPGNVRELRNALVRILSPGTLSSALAESDAPVSAESDMKNADLPYREARDQLLEDFELKYLRSLADKHGGDIAAASRAAGIQRHHLRALLRKHGLYRGRDA